MTGGADLVRFTQSLTAATSFEQLERAFLAGFGRLLHADVYGYELFDPSTGAPLWSTRATANETVDPRHVVELPLTILGRVCGKLHFGGGEYAPEELAVAEALAALLGQTVERLDSRRRLERERDVALAALELTDTPVVLIDPRAGEPRLNDAARRLLAEVVDGEGRLYALLGRRGMSRRIEVELAGGEPATIHSSAVPHADGGVVAVLELERERPVLAPGPLGALTPREQQVAALVVDGLADREIADRLCLSHHTVTQYVKQIYRKIDVDSRVALTRLLLTTRR